MGEATKAYMYQNYDGEATILFASSQGKAKSYALMCDICTEEEYTDIYVKRAPKFDHLAKPEGYELNWDIPEERKLMFDLAGFTCSSESFDMEECKECIVSSKCDKYAYSLRM